MRDLNGCSASRGADEGREAAEGDGGQEGGARGGAGCSPRLEFAHGSETPLIAAAAGGRAGAQRILSTAAVSADFPALLRRWLMEMRLHS